MFPLISSRYLLDKNPLVGHVAQILSIILWTGGLVAMKPASTFAPPLLVVPAQMILGTIILFIFVLLIQWKINYSSFVAGIGFGALAPGLAFTLNMIAATKTDILTITILWGLIPLLSPLLGRLFLSEPIVPSLYLGACVAVLGTFWLVTMRTSTGVSSLLGNMIAAAGVFCSLCGHILGRGLNRKYLKPLDMALGQIAGAAIVSSLMGFGYFLYVAFEESIFDLMGDLITFPIFLYLVIFATVINFPLYNFALSKIPVAWVSLYAVFVAPIGALFSNYFLNEPISQKDIIAIFIILSGVLIPSIHKIRREKFA